MPARPVNRNNDPSPRAGTKGGAAPKGKRGAWLRRQASDLKGVATGAVPALYQTLKAVDQALPHGGPAEGLLFEREGRHLDPSALKEQGSAQLSAIRDLADIQAWKEHTALNLLTAAGLAAPAAGGALKVTGRASKGPQTRTLKAKPKDEAQAKKWAKAKGLDPEKVSVRSTFKTEVPAAGPVTTRAAQRGIDKLREKIPAAQRRKVDRSIMAEQDILGRLHERSQPSFVESLKMLKRGEFTTPNRAYLSRAGLRDVNAAARGAILYRPGYVAPNLLGALGTNLVQMGADLPRQVVRGRKITRQLSPEARKRMLNMHGSGMTQAALDVGIEPRRMGEVNPQGPAGTFMSGVGESLSKVTDRRARDRAFLKEAERQGYKDAADIERLLDPNQVFSNPKLRRDLIQVVKRTEPAAIKFSRTTGGNKVDRLLAENIFLYKWLTGSARYTGHVAAQHPTLTAALANLPEGEDLSEALGGVALPGFMQGFIPYADAEGDELPKIINPQSLSLWETLPEVAETLSMAKEEPLQAIRHLAPVQKAGAMAATGYNPTTNRRISGFNEETGNPFYSRSGRDAPFSERLRWALEESVAMSPYSKVFPRYRSNLFPEDLKGALARLMVGGVMPRQVDPAIAAFIAASEGKERETPRRNRRRNQAAGF